jgi:hypothetical protein
MAVTNVVDLDLSTIPPGAQPMPGPQWGDAKTSTERFLGALAYQSGGGAELGEILKTARAIGEGGHDVWREQWTATAQQIEAVGEECLEKGHIASAREAFLRAATYYWTAGQFLNFYDIQVPWKQCSSAFERAGALMDPPLEVVQIPYEGSYLPGYFVRPDASGLPRPTALVTSGGHGTKVGLYFSNALIAISRGYNCLLWEGPGQRGATYEHAEHVMRHDYEVPVGAVVDYVTSRPDVDPERLALMGYSQGGFWVTRAVAFEKRIAACVADPLVPDIRRSHYNILQLDPDAAEIDREHLANLLATSDRITNFATEMAPRMGCPMGVDGLVQMTELVDNYELWGLEDKITCNFLAFNAQYEGRGMFDDATKFFDKMTCPKEFYFGVAGDGNELHCQNNNHSRGGQMIYDWLDEVFGVTG